MLSQKGPAKFFFRVGSKGNLKKTNIIYFHTLKHNFIRYFFFKLFITYLRETEVYFFFHVDTNGNQKDKYHLLINKLII